MTLDAETGTSRKDDGSRAVDNDALERDLSEVQGPDAPETNLSFTSSDSEEKTPISATGAHDNRPEKKKNIELKPQRINQAIDYREDNARSKSASTPDEGRNLAILDGSKLILRLSNTLRFHLDNSLNVKLMLSMGSLRKIAEATSVTWSTYISEPKSSGQSSSDENNPHGSTSPLVNFQGPQKALVVIDCNGAGVAPKTARFIPIPLACYDGIVYTRGNCEHVVIPGKADVKRLKLTGRALPHKYVNKFISDHYLNDVKHVDPEDFRKESAPSTYDFSFSKLIGTAAEVVASRIPSFSQRRAPSTYGPNVNFLYQAGATKDFNINLGGVIYLRASESIFRCILAEDQRVDFHDASVAAWTKGITFKIEQNFCCMTRVVAAQGPGVIWIESANSFKSQTLSATGAGIGPADQNPPMEGVL